MNRTQIAKLFAPLGFKWDSSEITAGARKAWLDAPKSYRFNKDEIFKILAKAFGKNKIRLFDKAFDGEVEFEGPGFFITWQPEFRTLFISIPTKSVAGIGYSLGLDT